MPIGEVARRAGVAASAIRYYERIGMLPAPDRVAGRRRYDESVLGRLAFIAAAQGAGFTLREIRALADGIDGEAGMASSMRALSAEKLVAVEELLERTRAIKGWLEVAQECGCASPEECLLFAPSADHGLPVIGNDCRRSAAEPV